MTKPVKTITLEFYRAGDVMPKENASCLVLGCDEPQFQSVYCEGSWSNSCGDVWEIDSDDLWAYWPDGEG